MLWGILSHFALNVDSGKSKNESGGRDNLYSQNHQYSLRKI